MQLSDHCPTLFTAATSRLPAVALAACLVNRQRMPGMLLAVEVLAERQRTAIRRPDRNNPR